MTTPRLIVGGAAGWPGSRAVAILSAATRANAGPWRALVTERSRTALAHPRNADLSIERFQAGAFFARVRDRT